VLAHGHSLRIISSRDPSESLIVAVRAEIVEATFGFVEELLGAFNGDYLTILRGARKQVSNAATSVAFAFSSRFLAPRRIVR